MKKVLEEPLSEASALSYFSLSRFLVAIRDTWNIQKLTVVAETPDDLYWQAGE